MDVPVSKVLHVRNLSPDAEANDLRQFVSSFGRVAYVVMLPKYNQALVEMTDHNEATNVIQFTQANPVAIKGKEAVFSFSKSQEIKRANPVSTPSEHQGEHVLLLTILNPLYAIDVNVLHSILSPFGPVLRIVIFHKNGTQALAEFSTPAAAAQAKANLDGKDIYDGCCTLRISFSRVEQLNVRCNNDKTRDFTNPNLPAQLPNDPQYGVPMDGQMGAMMHSPYQQPIYQPGYAAPLPPHVAMSMQPGAGAVVMVYSLPADLSCDRVFNLFCLYGNVVKIKLLVAKEGAAMVQMGDRPQAEQAIKHLNRVPFRGQELSLTTSKHPFIADNRAVVAGSEEEALEANPVCKDYSSSPCNRFTRQNSLNYKHIYPPTAVLFFSNVSPNIAEQQLTDVFVQLQVEAPTQLKFFTASASPRKTGLMEFASVDAAIVAVFVANNHQLEGHTLKLSFSANSFS